MTGLQLQFGFSFGCSKCALLFCRAAWNSWETTEVSIEKINTPLGTHSLPTSSFPVLLHGLSTNSAACEPRAYMCIWGQMLPKRTGEVWTNSLRMKISSLKLWAVYSDRIAVRLQESGQKLLPNQDSPYKGNFETYINRCMIVSLAIMDGHTHN